MDHNEEPLNSSRQLKEQFVSNLTGSSMLEVFFLITTFASLIILRRLITLDHSFSGSDNKDTSLKKSDDVSVSSRSLKAYIAAAALDFICIVVPSIMILTVLAEWSFVVAALLIFLLLVSAPARFGSSLSLEDDILSLRKNISSYRVSMMLVTCLCILVVDFRVFPRRYAKTETYGTSIMDLGVGSFVLANSLVSRQARGISKMSLSDAFLGTCPLTFLGFARLFTTSSVDYQVHVGEYGVHWNFFFTLAAVAILTSIVNIPPNCSATLGSIILLGYQVSLLLGLNEYLLTNKRDRDFISQNKEGVFSIFGYWGLYLVGIRLGNYLFFGDGPHHKFRTNRWARTRVLVLCVLFWFLTIFLDMYVERASRRMCNLAYVTLVLALNLQVLAILMLLPRPKISVLEEAFNQNMLGAFLLANVLTGLVNLCINTLSVSPFSALAILHMYALILSSLVGFAHFRGIRLKFW